MTQDPFGRPMSADEENEIEINNLDQIDDQPYWAPPGKWKLQCVGATKGMTKGDTPTEKIVFDFALIKPLSVSEPGAERKIGTILKVHAVQSPQALWRTKQILKALGFDINVPSFRLNLKACVGRTCISELKTRKEDFNGQMQSEISTFMPNS